jgi:putative Mn2+ efflux pump MntP
MLNLNTTFVFQFIGALAVVMAIVGFYLGKRKTHHPFLMALLGLCSAVFPPFALVFTLVLALRKDI